MNPKTMAFKVRKLNEHIAKLQAKIDRLKAARESLKKSEVAQ